MKKNDIFLIESYCFLWHNDEKVLLYNTLSGKSFLYPKINSLFDEFIDKLNNSGHLHTVFLSDDDVNCSAIVQFIQSARENYCGELLPSNGVEMPVVIAPEVNINEDVDRNLDDINNSAVFGSTVLKNLTDVFIDLGGPCKFACSGCGCLSKQIQWCSCSDSIMPIDLVKTLLSDIRYGNVFDIYFEGNVLEYPFFDELIAEIKSYSERQISNFNAIININHFCDSTYNPKIATLLSSKNIRLLVCIDAEDLTNEHLQIMSKYINQIDVICKVTNEEQFAKSYDLFSIAGINAIFLPYFTGDNSSFFETNIYQDENDILEPKLTKKEIFARQRVNSNFFGKIHVRPNGGVLANINGVPLGVYKFGFQEFIYAELKNGTFWRKTRDCVKPCDTCIYRYLCPPISNYEVVLDKFDMCHLRIK